MFFVKKKKERKAEKWLWLPAVGAWSQQPFQGGSLSCSQLGTDAERLSTEPACGKAEKERGLGLCTCLSAFMSHAEISPLYLDSLLKVKCVCVCVCVCVHMHVHAHMLSCILLFATTWTLACQAPLSMGFSRQEYWSGLLFPPPGDLPDLGIELAIVASKSGREKDPSRLTPVSRGHGRIKCPASPGACTFSNLDHVHPCWTALAEQTPTWSCLPGPLLCFTEI